MVRVVTPGTITDTELLADKQDAVLLAVAGSGRRFGLAWLSITQGEIGLSECSDTELPGWLARLAPAEILVDRERVPSAVLAGRWPVTNRPSWQFDAQLGLALGLGPVGLRAGWRTQILDDRGLADGVVHRDTFMGPYVGVAVVF